ncbi:NACHT domain-containing protein [Mycena sanguinolenta]|uniref:NACHT domain-containing protein n=1 Tax=Mycena sanguinolenta TaxID=230812 RepID=A0A8H6Z8G6_9AGAR|nr:NACHT domain-containing protein [Mycena sanguinolenta]
MGGHGMGPALNFDISAGSFTMHNLQQDGERGIDILHRSVALEAIHDSAESFPQPRCHPETRTKILEGLRGWALADMRLELDMDSEFESFAFRLDGPADPECRILWLYGPAGAGKSAIMQTLAEQLKDAGRLGGSFFFKRGHATRGNAKTLFATIAYQLALTVPWLRTSISQIVEHDPSVVIRSIATQMKTLVSKPCRAEAARDTLTILIDGLDECEKDDIQREILRAIYDASFTHTIPVRFIIASRPEPHIREVFDSPFYSDHHCSFNVEKSFEDVRKYLHNEFSRIHREHCTMASVPSPWPSWSVLEDLVRKSSGHFIYAATIIKFIDDKNYRPTQRLIVVQDGNNMASGLVFDALDHLYMTILGSTPRQAELAPILCAIANFQLSLGHVERLFELEDGEGGLLLRGLHSLLELDNNGSIYFHHASFRDFLKNPSRSQNFCTDNLDQRMTVARCFLQQLASGDWVSFNSPDSEYHHPFDDLIPFLIALPPSAELCLVIARMDPDWISLQRSADIRSLLSWLQKIPSAPQNLINLWEDCVFMASFRDSKIHGTTCSVKHILLPSSELCQVLVATVIHGLALWAVLFSQTSPAMPNKHCMVLLGTSWTNWFHLKCSNRHFGS